MYSPQVLDHFEHPRNSGELPDASSRAQLENPVCGDVLEFSIRVAKGKIAAARFRARGCVASVACASKLTEEVIGKSMDEARQIKPEALIESLGGLPQGSSHAGELAVDALMAALRKLRV
jgi:NifU-like protein involved in Fe-S cluster formation